VDVKLADKEVVTVDNGITATDREAMIFDNAVLGRGLTMVIPDVTVLMMEFNILWNEVVLADTLDILLAIGNTRVITPGRDSTSLTAQVTAVDNGLAVVAAEAMQLDSEVEVLCKHVEVVDIEVKLVETDITETTLDNADGLLGLWLTKLETDITETLVPAILTGK